MTTNRTNYTQLPEVKELEDIMAKEAKRKLARGKEQLHYPRFDAVENWLASIDIDAQIFHSNLNWKKTLTGLNDLIPEVVKNTLAKNPCKKIFDDIYAYLGEEDAPQKADIIFVFGSKSTARIFKAIEIYNTGLAPKIFITGGSPYYKSGEPEAEIFKQYAVAKGVPDKDILIDTKSISIADNVKRGLNMFDNWYLNYQKIIMVINWFAMRRSYTHMLKYIPNENTLYRVASDVDPKGDFAKDRWFKNESGIKVVFNEFVKMKVGILLNTN
jgi:hypothetical protein